MPLPTSKKPDAPPLLNVSWKPLVSTIGVGIGDEPRVGVGEAGRIEPERDRQGVDGRRGCVEIYRIRPVAAGSQAGVCRHIISDALTAHVIILRIDRANRRRPDYRDGLRKRAIGEIWVGSDHTERIGAAEDGVGTADIDVGA